MSNIYIESFFRAKILQSISNSQTTPFRLKVSSIPTLTSGLLTISSNTDNEEIVEYSVDGFSENQSDIVITKRGISPSCLGLAVSGTDYNNATYQRPHTTLDTIRGDINHLHVNQISQFSPNTDAGASVKGVTRLSVAPAIATEPIAVGDNDTRLSEKYALLTRTSGSQTFTNVSSVVEFPTASGSSDMIGTANKITIPVSGTYIVNASVRLIAPTVTGNRSISIFADGNVISQSISTDMTDSYNQSFNTTVARYFASGVVLDVRIFSTGANTTISPTSQTECRFEVIKT